VFAVEDDRIVINCLVDEAQLDRLRPLWLALHQLHRSLMPAGLLVADDEVSWQRRRETYRAWVVGGEAIVLVASRAGGLVAYAVAHRAEGPVDTFDVGQTYAELYSLSVAPRARGLGIGTTLLDRLDAMLAQEGIEDLVVAVMTDNVGARRFYERRGLLPTEMYYWRVKAPGRQSD
jgi:ribosomal protein S18 acetylase RimI-like enzyme